MGADMQCASNEAAQLQELLASEAAAQRELHQENAELAASSEALRLVIRSALDGYGDIECDSFVNALMSENLMLRKLLQISQTASRMSSSALQMPPPASPVPPKRPSLGARSRTSSTSTASPSTLTPSRNSPSLAAGGVHGQSPGSPLPQADSPGRCEQDQDRSSPLLPDSPAA